MTPSLSNALIAGAAKVLGFPPEHPLRRTPTSEPAAIAAALQRLREQLVALDPAVTDAVVASSFDGTPERRNLNLRLYFGEPEVNYASPDHLARIVLQALECAWAFEEFLPVGFSVQAWRGGQQVVPYDNSARIDLAPVLDSLRIDGAHVVKKFLSATARDLEVRFGPRPSDAL